MKKIIKAVYAIYIVAFLTEIMCIPLSAIFVILKLCGAVSLSWTRCCVPFIIALSVLPFYIITKSIIDGKEK